MFEGLQKSQESNPNPEFDPTSRPSPQGGGRRRKRGSRSRKGRKGKGGYLMDVAVAAGLLGATQLSKRRYGYNGPRRYGYSSSTRKRSSRRSRS